MQQVQVTQMNSRLTYLETRTWARCPSGIPSIYMKQPQTEKEPCVKELEQKETLSWRKTQGTFLCFGGCIRGFHPIPSWHHSSLTEGSFAGDYKIRTPLRLIQPVIFSKKRSLLLNFFFHVDGGRLWQKCNQHRKYLIFC